MKKFLLMAAMFIASLFFVTSCEEYDPDGLTYNSVEVTQKYENAFIEAFGQPAENQAWGFPKQSTRIADPKGNMWEEEGYVIPADITNAEREKVLPRRLVNLRYGLAKPKLPNTKPARK